RRRLGTVAHDHGQSGALPGARVRLRHRSSRPRPRERALRPDPRSHRGGTEEPRLETSSQGRRAEALVRAPGGGIAMRIFFATDIHGSETCWKKFLNSGEHYKADVVILGGDMTGKALVPIVDDGGGHWHATLLENRNELDGEDAVQEFELAVQRRGYYPFRTDSERLSELA